MKDEEIIEVVQAHIDGAEIQHRNPGGAMWLDSAPEWHFGSYEYRAKPFEPEVGKLYFFWDKKEKAGRRAAYQGKNNSVLSDIYPHKALGLNWKHCRIINPDELGK